MVRRFDARVDRLWERLSDRFALAVRRDSRYLNWKYVEPPHVRYLGAVASRRRGRRLRRLSASREPQGRVTQIVDLLADPSDERGIKTLARWVDREARMNDSDKIRCHVSHARVPPRAAALGLLRREVGHRSHREGERRAVPKGFYDSVDEWHFTLGDGDLDH